MTHPTNTTEGKITRSRRRYVSIAARVLMRLTRRSTLRTTALIASSFIVVPAATSQRITSAHAKVVRATREKPGDSTIVVLLGTGMPRPDPDASGPATAVLVGHRVFLFDAGPGVMRRMAAARLPINGVTALFITHLHSDHTLGLPDLIFTSWVMGRQRALEAYGPHGLKQMTEHIIAAWKEDEDVRANGLEHERAAGYSVNVHEIQPGVVYDSGSVRITAFPVLHGSWKEAYGYRIDTPTRSVVISGDTRPSSALIAAAHNVDVLVHEVYSAARLAPETRRGGADWPLYMHEFHTSDLELGRIAEEAKPKLLVLTHIGRMGSSDDDLIRGIRAGAFGGRVVVGHDLGRY